MRYSDKDTTKYPICKQQHYPTTQMTPQQLQQHLATLSKEQQTNQQSPIGTDAPVAPATATTVAGTRIAYSINRLRNIGRGAVGKYAMSGNDACRGT